MEDYANLTLEGEDLVHVADKYSEPDYSDLEKKLEISDNTLLGLLKDLDDVEETSGLRDAYLKVETYTDNSTPPSFDFEYDFFEIKDSKKEVKYTPKRDGKTHSESVSDHNKEVMRVAQEHVSKIKEKTLMGQTYVAFDKSLNDVKFAIMLEGPAMWTFMYEVSGSIYY